MSKRWFCGHACFETALVTVVESLLPTVRPRIPHRHAVPLGLILLSQGVITKEHLRDALQAAREAGRGLIGQWLRQLADVSEIQIAQALARQWSCPLFPLDGHSKILELASLLPVPLLESSHMVAAHYLSHTRHLYLAFSFGIDHSALFAAEHMLECRAVPCLSPESAVENALEKIRQHPRPPEVVFDSLRESSEIARVVRNYASLSSTEHVRVVACGAFLWIRLEGHGQMSNLLFHIPQDAFPEREIPSPDLVPRSQQL